MLEKEFVVAVKYKLDPVNAVHVELTVYVVGELGPVQPVVVYVVAITAPVDAVYAIVIDDDADKVIHLVVVNAKPKAGMVHFASVYSRMVKNCCCAAPITTATASKVNLKNMLIFVDTVRRYFFCKQQILGK